MTEGERGELLPCPVRSAHRRLMDCHELWHATERNYMDPEGFRQHPNNLIQNLRNVTWLLQKQKAQLPDFNTWYQQWRDSISNDPAMKWLVAARNRIVKESDLELLSRADMRISLDWLNEVAASWTMPPRYTTREILIRLLSSQNIPPIGMLTSERRWIERHLPNYELLDALAHVYGLIASVIATAHCKAGVTKCDLPSREFCVTSSLASLSLNCMQQWDGNRRLHINLHNRVELSEQMEIVPDDPVIDAVARERYGDVPMSGDAIERVSPMLEPNKRMLIADKSLTTVALFFKDKHMIGTVVLDFYDQGSKRLVIHRLAERAERLRADGIMLISEIWHADMEPGEKLSVATPPARARANPKEGIQVLAITRDGRQANAMCLFTRDPNGDIVLGDTFDNVQRQANLLEPIRRRWASTTAP